MPKRHMIAVPRETWRLLKEKVGQELDETPSSIAIRLIKDGLLGRSGPVKIKKTNKKPSLRKFLYKYSGGVSKFAYESEKPKHSGHNTDWMWVQHIFGTKMGVLDKYDGLMFDEDEEVDPDDYVDLMDDLYEEWQEYISTSTKRPTLEERRKDYEATQG